MPPFIQYHIDPFSILVVIEHITFTSVFSTAVIGRWGRLCGARTSDHAISPATDHATTVAHTQRGGGGDNIQSGPEGQVFPGIVTLPPQHERAPKTSDCPK